MKDTNGTEIKEGQTLRRIIDSGGGRKGQTYTVVLKKWSEEDEQHSLVADGGFIKELLSVRDTAEEYEVIQ